MLWYSFDTIQGISGTQVAINASHIVLLDDNFTSIVSAIKWGRNVLNSVRKFLQFQLSVNFVAVFITIISSAVVGNPIIHPASLLWINLIMDRCFRINSSLGALALASEKPDHTILKQRPHRRSAHMLTADMQFYIFVQTIFQVVVLVTMQYKIDPNYYNPKVITDQDREKHLATIVFTSFVLLQVSNQIMARQLNHEVNILKSIFRNRLFLIVQGIIVVVQILVVEFGFEFFQILPMNINEWIICIIAGLSNIGYTLFIRIILYFNKMWRIKKRKKRTKKTVDLEG